MPTATVTSPTSARSRSPSPPPPPPVGDAPGPRATALQNAFNKALESTLKKCSYENFAACFPTPANYRPETMDAFWRDFTGRLSIVCKAEIDALLTERAVVPSLNNLDRLVADAKKRKERAEAAASDNTSDNKAATPTPPHTLPPSVLHQAHLLPFLTSHTATLQSDIAATQAANAELLNAIDAQRAELEALVSGLEAVVGDIEASAGLLQGEEVRGLEGEVLEIEMALRE